MDRFEALRKAQEGTLEKTPFTPEDQLEAVSNEGKNSRVMTCEEKRAKILNMILLIMVFALIGVFVYLFFTDRLLIGVENPLSKGEVVDIQEKEEEEEVLAQDQEEFRLFKNTREILDSEGNVVGNQELTVKFFTNEGRFEMDVQNALGNGVVVEGTYVEEGDRVLLSFASGEFGLETDGSLEFKSVSEDGTVLEYSGSDFGDTLPDEGDRYLLY